MRGGENELAYKRAIGRTRRAERVAISMRVAISISGVFAMNTSIFQIDCGDCGSLAIMIENPESAAREAIVYCADCGASRGTVGALRDLAVRLNGNAVPPTRPRLPSMNGRSKPKCRSEISERYNEVQSLRLKVQMAESRWRTTLPDMLSSPNDRRKIEWD
jgi:hypothetical protein